MPDKTPTFAAPADTLCSPSITLAEADAILTLIEDNYRITHDASLSDAARRIEAAIIHAIDTCANCVEIKPD